MRGGGGRKQTQPASLIVSVRDGCGGGGRGRSESKYVLALNATCMHVDVSLSHILISPFCCYSLFRYKKVPQELYTLKMTFFDFSNRIKIVTIYKNFLSNHDFFHYFFCL